MRLGRAVGALTMLLPLACSDDDGEFVGGFDAGTSGATADTTGTGGGACGNGAIEGQEVCDSADLGGEDCTTLGFSSGPLACLPGCNGFDISQCEAAPGCGNGVVEQAEECDGTNLAGRDCVALGFSEGTLQCTLACTFDTSGCFESCVEDALEDNDAAADATMAPTPFTESGLRICPGDDDYFQIVAAQGQTIAASISFSHAEGDLNLELRISAGVVAASSSQDNDESLSFPVGSGLGGTYFVRVYGVPSAGAQYDVTLTVSATCDAVLEFACDDTSCVPSTAVCDETVDCADATDEFPLNPACCDPTSEFACAEGTCVGVATACDASSDCPDASDEYPLNPQCCDPVGEFTCGDGGCIGVALGCDGAADCGDSSDEFPLNPACCDPVGEFECGDAGCIPGAAACDGSDDCVDGSDEFPTNPVCCDPVGEFECADGSCIALALACDGAVDCGDNSDEFPQNAACLGSPTQAGDALITEIMQNPAALTDVEGEYFEVHNPGVLPLDLIACEVTSAGAAVHTIAASVVVLAGGYTGLSRGNAPGFAPDYVYGDVLDLADGSGDVGLRCGGTDIDVVAWDDGATFPDPDGAALNLDPGAFGAVDNNVGSNWCRATTDLGNTDLGSPAAANEACPAAAPGLEFVDGCEPFFCTDLGATGPNGGQLFRFEIPAAAHPTVNDFEASCFVGTPGADLVIRLPTAGAVQYSVSTCSAVAGDSSIAVYFADPATLPPENACDEDAAFEPLACSELADSGAAGPPLALPLSGAAELWVVVDELGPDDYWDDATLRTIDIELAP